MLGQSVSLLRMLKRSTLAKPMTVDVSDVAGNPAVQATRTLAHDAIAPTIVINPIATDDIINALEDKSPVAIGGTTTGVENGQTLNGYSPRHHFIQQ